MSKSPTVQAYSVSSREALLSDGRWVKARYQPNIGDRVMIDRHGYIRPYGNDKSLQASTFKDDRIIVGDDQLRRETGLRHGLSFSRSSYFRGE